MPSVLFVCTANRFRSPLASAFFQKALDDSAMTGTWAVDSAGTWTSTGLPILPGVSLIARKYGVDLSRHRSKLVSEALLASHNLVLVMEPGHKDALQHEFPSISSRVYLLSEAAEGIRYSIPDLTDSFESMMEVGVNLYDLVRSGFNNICDLALRLQETSE